MGKRINWSLMQKTFDKEREKDNQLTLTDFCKRKKLNYETARKRLINSKPVSGSESPVVRDRSPLLENRKTVLDRDGNGCFKSGNKAALKHGGYAEYFDIDSQSFDAESPLDELQLLKFRLHNVANYEYEMKSEIARAYKNGEVKSTKQGELSLHEALFNVDLNLREVNKDLINSYSKLLACNSVSAQRAMQRKQLAILDECKGKELTAAETVRELEFLGIDVPSFLMFEARQEVIQAEAVIDDNGLSDDELDSICRAYEVKQKDYVTNELPARRELLSKMIDEQAQKENGLGEFA